MDAYAFNAALWCEDCTRKLKDEIPMPPEPYAQDSEEYPQGPFANGGGESDTPQHCGGCDIHLENPLTSDGEAYVLQALEEGLLPDEWREYYAYLFETNEAQ